jgi:hypothetical protein
MANCAYFLFNRHDAEVDAGEQRPLMRNPEQVAAQTLATSIAGV